MSSYNDLDPSQRAVADAALRRLGITSDVSSQSRVSGALDAGAGAGAAAANAMASNRSAKVDAAISSEQLNQGRQGLAIQREADRRAGQDQAMRTMQTASYLDAGGRPYTAPTVKGKQLPTYGFGPVAATEFERQNASAAGSEAQNRLARRDSLLANIQPDFQIDPKLLKSGKLESILGIGSAAAKILAGLF